jgi:hypothetical protein
MVRCKAFDGGVVIGDLAATTDCLSGHVDDGRVHGNLRVVLGRQGFRLDRA